jgi:SOS response regulatory protein OraA/RecX
MTAATRRASDCYEVLFDDEPIFYVHPPFFRYIKKVVSTHFSDKESCLQALYEAEYRYGMRYAIWTMSRSSIHSETLKERMLLKKFSQKTTLKIIQECQNQGYLNDEDFVLLKAQKLATKGKSRRAILYNLQSLSRQGGRRIPQEKLPQKLSQELPQDHDILLQLLPKRYTPLLDSKTPKQVQERLLRRLLRQGFSLNDIKNVLKELQIK